MELYITPVCRRLLSFVMSPAAFLSFFYSVVRLFFAKRLRRSVIHDSQSIDISSFWQLGDFSEVNRCEFRQSLCQKMLT